MCGDNRFTYWEPLVVHSVWLTCSTANLHIPWYPMRAFSAAHNNFTRKDILKLVIINWFGVEHQLLWSLEKELSNKASRSSFKWITEVLATYFVFVWNHHWADLKYVSAWTEHAVPLDYLQDIINHLRQHSHCTTYGTGMTAPVAVQILTSLKIIMGEDGTNEGTRLCHETHS